MTELVHLLAGTAGEQVVIYRRTLANITGGAGGANAPPGATIVRPAGGGPHHVTTPGYPRTAGPHSPHAPGQGAPNVVAGGSQHYPRPHLFGHDTNIMLPRELCLVGCVFYIADYHAELLPTVIDTWRRVIQQHGGEVVGVYEGSRVTHILCKNQQSPMFLQGVKENKRCITVFWLNDILLRGKMAPPWQAMHLPTPFGNDNKPCKDLVISVTGFENEEKAIVKLMLQLVGAKHTGNFSKSNHILISKKFEGSTSAKVVKAREYRKPIVNGIWLSEVLLGQNVPPLVCHGTKYQHQLDDPLRIDPSLASHLFNAWKFPISVSKESVEKAKAVREMALRKRKSEVVEVDQENKRPRVDACLSMPLPELSSVMLSNDGHDTSHKKPAIMLSNVKNKPEMERKVLELGGVVVNSANEASHLVMGGDGVTATRTCKLMCAVSCCSHIVSLAWLLHSYQHSTFISESVTAHILHQYIGRYLFVYLIHNIVLANIISSRP